MSRRYRNSNFTFDSTAKIYRPRTRFNLNHERITTMNVGTLYPVDVQEVYPGDEYIDKDVMLSQLISSYLRPSMGNLFMDIHVFFVPSRLVYNEWGHVFGSASPSQYSSPTYAAVPQFADITGASAPEWSDTGVLSHLYAIRSSKSVGTVNQNSMKFTVLLARAFALIYDEWYRDQNNVNPMQVQKGDAAVSEQPNTNAWAPNNYTGELPKVRKIHDYFTSCLPAPQKGSSVNFPLGQNAPVRTNPTDVYAPGDTAPALHFYEWQEGTNELTEPSAPRAVFVDVNVNSGAGKLTAINGGSFTPISSSGYVPANLIADLTGATSTSVNDLRLAFQTQRILERDARTGSRYTEYIRAAFGVSPSDARLQRPEYIAGWRQPMSIQQVPQTSAGTDESPLAIRAAFSQSSGRGRWHKAFEEHGFVIICASIRQLHVYQQGVERFLTRKTRYDFYDPELAHIGEQPVYKSELFYSGNSSDFDTPFGYNEAFADLRYRPSVITGQARSGAKLPGGADSDLDIWHFGDNYANAPTLNEQFIEETPDYVDRDISVPSTSQDQFLVNFYFKRDGIRRVPSRGTPERIDHTYGGY